MIIDASADLNIGSTSSDIPTEISKNIIEPVELDDIDVVFQPSPTSCSEVSDFYINDSPMAETVQDTFMNLSPLAVNATAFERMSVCSKLDACDQAVRKFELLCEDNEKKILEIEQCLKSSTAKEKEKASEHQRNGNSSYPELQTQKLLQFIKRCLDNSALSNIIQYTDKDKTEFKIIDMPKFVKLWGDQKGKSKSPRKISRSIAYLINIKGQLKKIGKMKYRILDDNINASSSKPPSPIESEVLSPSSSELSSETTTSDILNHCSKQDSGTSSPLFFMRKSEPNNVPAMSKHLTATDVKNWLLKNINVVSTAKSTSVAHDVISTGSTASNSLLTFGQSGCVQTTQQSPVSNLQATEQSSISNVVSTQQSPVSRLQAIQQATGLTFIQNPGTPFNQQMNNQQHTINEQSCNKYTLVNENNSNMSVARAVPDPLINIEALAINSTISKDFEMSEINEKSSYSFCLNPSQLTVPSDASLHQLDLSFSSSELYKLPCESVDDSLDFDTDIDSSIDFNTERLTSSNVEFSAHSNAESHIQEDNLTEMALIDMNMNPNLQYSTVNNIINSQEFHSTFPEFNDSTLFARALSNESIQFDIFNDDFQEKELFGKDLFPSME